MDFNAQAVTLPTSGAAESLVQVSSSSTAGLPEEPASGVQAVLLHNRDVVLRFLRARGVADAEDVLQELWIKIGSGPTGPIADPIGYIMRSAHNLAIDHRRSEATRVDREHRWAAVCQELDESCTSASADRIAIAREELDRIQRALRSLRPKTRTIFYRCRIDGLSRSEVAREMSISVSSVEKHLHKAYALIHSLVQHG